MYCVQKQSTLLDCKAMTLQATESKSIFQKHHPRAKTDNKTEQKQTWTAAGHAIHAMTANDAEQVKTAAPKYAMQEHAPLPHAQTMCATEQKEILTAAEHALPAKTTSPALQTLTAKAPTVQQEYASRLMDAKIVNYQREKLILTAVEFVLTNALKEKAASTKQIASKSYSATKTRAHSLAKETLTKTASLTTSTTAQTLNQVK